MKYRILKQRYEAGKCGHVPQWSFFGLLWFNLRPYVRGDRDDESYAEKRIDEFIEYKNKTTKAGAIVIKYKEKK